jgi:alpha-glucoside transport system substrate-binding protein
MSKSFKIVSVFVLAVMVLAACAPTATPAATTPPTVPPAAIPTTAPSVPTAAPVTAPTATTAPATAPTATTAPTAGPTAAPTLTPAPTASGSIDCTGVTAGDTITVMYQWSGVEEQEFNNIMAPFINACGVKISANSTRDSAVLDAAVKSTPPDILFWPTTAPLKLYTDKLIPITDVGVDPSNYADFWLKLGTVNGKLMTLPAKVDIKTFIWYSPAQFAANGYTVPTTLADLETLVDKMVANGQVPWAMGFASTGSDGWAGSDFIQNLLLAMQGPDYVNGIIDGTVPYNDPGVLAAYQLYVKWASDSKYTVGGATGTVSTTFNDAILQPFAEPPQAMMVAQASFAGATIAAAYPNLKYGTDYAFFPFPGAKGVQGSFDLTYAFTNNADVKAMLAYITGPVGSANWAATGFSIDPNKQAQGKFLDPVISDMAKILFNAQGFTPDIGDTIGGTFGQAEWTAIINSVQGQDIQTQLNTAEAAQMSSLGK